MSHMRSEAGGSVYIVAKKEKTSVVKHSKPIKNLEGLKAVMHFDQNSSS